MEEVIFGEQFIEIIIQIIAFVTPSEWPVTTLCRVAGLASSIGQRNEPLPHIFPPCGWQSISLPKVASDYHKYLIRFHNCLLLCVAMRSSTTFGHAEVGWRLVPSNHASASNIPLLFFFFV